MRSLELQHFNRFYFFYEIDYLYGKILSLLKKIRNDKIFSEEDIQTIKEIDRSAFPEFFRFFEEIEEVNEILEFCRCSNVSQIDYYNENGWYILVARHYNCVELISCASHCGKCNDIFKIVKYIKDKYEKKIIYADCRETTSYRFFTMLNKRNKIDILNDWKRLENGEELHDIKFRVVKR